VCVCSSRYRKFTAHVPYWHLWPAMVHNICQHSHKRRYFRKRNLLNTKRVLWFSLKLLTETFLFLRSKDWDMVKNAYWSSCKEGVMLVRFEWNLNFLNIFSKNIQILISWQTVQWKPSCSIRTDGQTEMTKLTVTFRNFAKASFQLTSKFYFLPYFAAFISWFHSPC